MTQTLHQTLSIAPAPILATIAKAQNPNLNKTAATLALVRAIGHRICFEINDDVGRIEANAKRTQSPSVPVGVTTPYTVPFARTGANRPSRKDYSVVTHLTPVDAFILGTGVDSEDDKGRKATNQSLRIALGVNPGDPAQSAVAHIRALTGTR